MSNGTHGSHASEAVDSRPSFAVVDYGVNNIGSVLNMLRRIDVDASPARDAADLRGKSALVLPGIGSFDAGVTNLHAAGLFEGIREAVRDGVPILGICLGMQLLSNGSEEGKLPGLGLLPAYTRRFAFGERHRSLKVPHMGWNETDCSDVDLFGGFEGPPRFYYVHSYHVVCDDPADVAARCLYGEPFVAAVRHGSVFGTQFHPEKSHRFGMRVLQNFARFVSHG